MLVALAGGVGAAKLLVGLTRLLQPRDLAVIVNTGDDLLWLGLRICPDLDTVVYTLAGLANPQTGWGVKEDTFHCLQQLGRLGHPGWFQVGDRDLALHLWRSRALAQGESLTELTARLCRRLDLPWRLLPMSDGYAPTRLLTEEGELHVQEYLVREGCRPRLFGFRYGGEEGDQPTAAVREALQQAQGIILCPSNPFISLGPILALPGVREALRRRRGRLVGVSPIVAGKALKGPLAKMLRELDRPVSPLSIADFYGDLLDVLVVDEQDEGLAPALETRVPRLAFANTVMVDLRSKIELAGRLLELL